MATFAVIMAGGGGTRLWPASRRGRPKQLLALLPDGETLLGATVRRITPLVPPERVLVVTAAAQAEGVRRALPALPRANLLVEPVGRNTAPCIGWAALEARRRDPGAVLAVLPADHHVADEPAFRAAVAAALAAAAERRALVTCGIRPTRPETGFGYVELGDEVAPGLRAVRRFVEKPDLETARGYLAGGRHLWNSGLFFFGAERILEEIRRSMPALARGLDRLDAGEALDPIYPTLPSESIDYGVMERAEGLLVVPGDFGWSDVGSWSALAELLPADADGQHALGAALAVAARDNVVYAEDDRLVALVGVEGLCVVVAGDAVLVCPRDQAQRVRAVVDELGRRGLERYL